MVIKTIIGGAAAVVYAADFIHVYSYLNSYYALDTDEEPAEETEEDRRIVQAYADDCSPPSLVSEQEFQQCVETVLKELEEESIDSGLYPLDHIGLIVNRESIGFLGGGRATFMQLAHPFVAAGIKQHSLLEYGVSRRFYNTFKYMFGMSLGSPAEIAASARAVHGLHAKVFGAMEEEVGIFQSSSRFSAAEKNAIRYVGATLLETAVFEFEMHVRMLTMEEKDQLVRSGARLLMLFGVRPSVHDPTNWKDFRHLMSLLFRSKLLTVGETAKDTAEFLLLPPSSLHAPSMNILRWSIGVCLPPRLSKQYTGRVPNTLDKIVFSLLHAMIRFFYRLAPGSWRYLTAYWRMYDRVRPGERSSMSKFVSAAAAQFTSLMLKGAMPERNPEEARRRVQEIRKNRTAV